MTSEAVTDADGNVTAPEETKVVTVEIVTGKGYWVLVGGARTRSCRRGYGNPHPQPRIPRLRTRSLPSGGTTGLRGSCPAAGTTEVRRG